MSSEAYRKLLHLLLYQQKLKLLHLFLYQQKLTENCCIFCCINRSLQKNCCIFCCIIRSLQKTIASFAVSAEAYRKLLYLLLHQQKLTKKKLLHLLLYQQKLTENCCIFCCISRSLQKTVVSFVASTEAVPLLVYWTIQAGLLTPLTFARRRLSPFAAFTSGAYFLHNGRR